MLEFFNNVVISFTHSDEPAIWCPNIPNKIITTGSLWVGVLPITMTIKSCTISFDVKDGDNVPNPSLIQTYGIYLYGPSSVHVFSVKQINFTTVMANYLRLFRVYGSYLHRETESVNVTMNESSAGCVFYEPVCYTVCDHINLVS